MIIIGILGVTLALLALLVLFSVVEALFNNLGWLIFGAIIWFIWDAINTPRPY